MSERERRPPSGLRLAWAIASKDIVDAVKSMTTVSIILGTVVLILSSQALPLLLSRSGELSLIVYDPGETRLVQALSASDGVLVTPVDSLEELRARVTLDPREAIGIDVPPGIDETLDSGATAALAGYVAWSNRGQATDLVENLEREIAAVRGGTGMVAVDEQLIYPQRGSFGSWGLFQSSFVLQLLIVGVYVVSYLIFDEKEAKTMDALLVSPASAAQVVTGKVIAGAFYCAVAAAAAIAVGWPAVVHWDVLIVTGAAVALVSVSLGLLGGIMFDTAQQMGLWFVIPLLALVAGLVASEIADRLPPALALLVSLLPTAAGAEALQLALVGEASLLDALPQLAIVLAWAAASLAVVVARVRRMDR